MFLTKIENVFLSLLVSPLSGDDHNVPIHIWLILIYSY